MSPNGGKYISPLTFSKENGAVFDAGIAAQNHRATMSEDATLLRDLQRAGVIPLDPVRLPVTRVPQGFLHARRCPLRRAQQCSNPAWVICPTVNSSQAIAIGIRTTNLAYLKASNPSPEGAIQYRFLAALNKCGISIRSPFPLFWTGHCAKWKSGSDAVPTSFNHKPIFRLRLLLLAWMPEPPREGRPLLPQRLPCPSLPLPFRKIHW